MSRYLCVFATALLLAAASGNAQNQLPPGTQDPDSAPSVGKGAVESKSERDAAETKIDQHDFEGARPLLQKYLSRNPNDARALFDLGYVEDAGSREDAAAADYGKAIAADPKQFEARLALGLLLAHQGKFDQARDQLEQATVLSPNPPNPAAQAEAFRSLAELDRSSDPAAARDALMSALKLSPETPSDLLLTAQIAESNGDLELAQTAYQRVLARRPAVSESMQSAANAGLAQLLIKQKKYSDAEPLLKSRACSAIPVIRA